MVEMAIEYLHKYQISRADLEDLDPDLRAGIVLTSYAVTECNMLMRMYINAQHPNTGNDFIDMSNLSVTCLLLRTWSSKLFEFYELIRGGARWNRTTCAEWRKAADEILAELKPLEGHEGFKFARTIRNDAASHYSLEAARDNDAFVKMDFDFSIYVHEAAGSSFFPAGESVMFIGRINRHRSKLPKEIGDNIFHHWMDWNRDATIILSNSLVRMISNHIFARFPDRYAKREVIYVPYSMVQEMGVPTLPLFFRRPKD